MISQLTLEKMQQPPFIKNLFASTSDFLKASRKRPLAQPISPSPGGKGGKKAKAGFGASVQSAFSAVCGFICEGGAPPGKPGFGAGFRRKRWADEAEYG